VTRLTALFDADADIVGTLERLGEEIGRPRSRHTIEPVPDTDWVRKTQAQFAPMQASERMWIVPSWCDAVDPAAINLALDPGLAFGTGSHPSTRLCLRWLRRELRAGEAVLDFGCGSGILAIAAGRLGASRVMGTDIDPHALTASRTNATRNGVDATFLPVDGLSATDAFDVVVANILANPLMALAPALSRHVRPAGRIVLSGILDAQADAVMTVYDRWFTIGVCERDEGWCALAEPAPEALPDPAVLRPPALVPLRCPTKNTPAARLARRCSASRRPARRARRAGSLRPVQDGVRRRRARGVALVARPIGRRAPDGRSARPRWPSAKGRRQTAAGCERRKFPLQPRRPPVPSSRPRPPPTVSRLRARHRDERVSRSTSWRS
jgi:ribosomal protein L11 methyltransferase